MGEAISLSEIYLDIVSEEQNLVQLTGCVVTF